MSLLFPSLISRLGLRSIVGIFSPWFAPHFLLRSHYCRSSSTSVHILFFLSLGGQSLLSCFPMLTHTHTHTHMCAYTQVVFRVFCSLLAACLLSSLFSSVTQYIVYSSEAVQPGSVYVSPQVSVSVHPAEGCVASVGQ